MRIVNSELVVCGAISNILEAGQETPAANDPEDTIPSSTFKLGSLADSSITLRREGSALEMSDSSDSQVLAHSIPRSRRHALDKNTKETAKALFVPAAKPQTASPVDTETTQSIDPLIPHGPAHQPPTEKLLKALPSSIRDRANSLDEPHPLPFRWKLPSDRRFRIGDPDAFVALKEKNIEWYVTTGLLVEDCTGLRWNAGTYKYLLYWHVEGMPTPNGIDTGHKWLRTRTESVRDWQKDKWEAEFGSAVVDDEPATPIVERRALIEPQSPLNKVRSRPPTPSRERPLLPGCKSALRSQIRPVSPCPSITSDSGSLKREKRVRLQRESWKRIVEWEFADANLPEEEHGRVVETNVDETGVLVDNEGRTARKWMGMN